LDAGLWTIQNKQQYFAEARSLGMTENLAANDGFTPAPNPRVMAGGNWSDGRFRFDDGVRYRVRPMTF
jgi:hypothetical protein